MKHLLLLSILNLLLFLFCNGQYKVNKEVSPSWITQTTINYTQSNLDADAEDGYVYIDYEKQVSIATQTRYYRTAIKILSESGVQNSSEVSVDFDPSYQKLTFHTLKIIRGNEIIDKLPSAKFKLVQQEKELDKHLYDGSLTAISFLEDVRKGDVIEYSYSIRGFNPIFAGKFSSFLDVQFSVPVYNLYYKLIIQKDKNLSIKNRGTDIKPVVQQRGSETIYEWKLNQLQPLRVPDHTPGWYDPYGMIMISEFNTWKDLNDWAKKLYPLDLDVSGALQKKIDEIVQANPSVEAKTLAALRLVQDDIRYTGIEAGENSHKPHHPDQIFRQRFGDCKDKSYLLCVMLRKMGVEADPVLINTSAGKGIENWLPSPGIFDHVTVRAIINKETYWFDPTISFQRGNINSISYPDYKCGLVISETTNSLTEIPLREKGVLTAKETFNVPDMSGLAYLIVKTEYSGLYADNVREDFKNNSRYEMLERYKKYYSSTYEELAADSISFSDDEVSGVATTMEYYTIKDFWKLKSGTKQSHLESFLINGVLKKPEQANRKFPYSQNFPANYKEQIEINLPDDWGSSETSDVIEMPSSILKYKFSGTGSRVVLDYEYKTLKDFIAPEEIESYLAAYKKMDNNTGYLLTYNDNNNTTSSGPIGSDAPKSIFSGLYSVLILALIITIVIRRNRKRNNYWN